MSSYAHEQLIKSGVLRGSTGWWLTSFGHQYTPKPIVQSVQYEKDKTTGKIVTIRHPPYNKFPPFQKLVQGHVFDTDTCISCIVKQAANAEPGTCFSVKEVQFK